MKRLLIILYMMALALYSQAQLITSPLDIQKTPEEFSMMYGTVAIYNTQVGRMAEGNAPFFVGTKVTYVKEIVQYLAEHGCGRSSEYDFGNNWLRYEVPVNGVGMTPADKITIKATIDPKTYITQKVTITGHPDVMVALFLQYWDAPLSLAQLKQQGIVFQDNGNDRVKFSWVPKSNPVITIDKSPNVYFKFASK